MTQLVTLDIGGTNARFALASVKADGAITLGEVETFKTSDHLNLQSAWEAFSIRIGGTLPAAASIAIAAPMGGKTVRMTNNDWSIQPDLLAQQLGLEKLTLLNDFGAMAYAAAQLDEDQFLHLAGPDQPLPSSGTITVIGPGTGLGIAHFWRGGQGSFHVQATEGSHFGFAPYDNVDDLILARLRKVYGRASVERVVSGPGIIEIYKALATIKGQTVPECDDYAIWQNGMDDSDSLAAAAIEHFCHLLGSVAGDYALAHGASAVVVAGGLGYRIREALLSSDFAERFRAKGRYEQMMAAMPVKLITHPQPGLFGAAAAFAKEHLS